MIRNDINISLDQIDNYFLEHRPGIDQPGYRVGKIGEELIVYNPKTKKFMDYFYDDSEEEWFDLETYKEKYSGYLINREGEVIGLRGKKLSKMYDLWNYPIYKVKGEHPKIHNMIGGMFVPRYDLSKDEIDHIEGNKEKYTPKDLRWADREDQANNITRHKFVGDHIYRGYEDKEKTKLVIELTEEELYNSSDYDKGKIRNSIKQNCRSKGLYWEAEDLRITNYLELIGETYIDESLFIEHYLGGFSVHPFGIIKDERGNLTIGTLNDKNSKYKMRRYKNSTHGALRVSILVAEVHINGNKPLDSGMEVNHIDTNPENNKVSNLEICSHEENMNNPITIENCSKKIIDSEGKIYQSLSIFAKEHNMKVSYVWAMLNGKRPNRFGLKYYTAN